MSGGVRPEIKVEGADQLRKQLRAIDKGTEDLKAAHKAGAEIVLAGAHPPRRTGALAASGRAAGQAGQGVVRWGKASVPYAPVIHFGWPGHNISPQPWAYDAVESKRAAVLEVYSKAVNRLIDDHGLAP